MKIIHPPNIVIQLVALLLIAVLLPHASIEALAVLLGLFLLTNMRCPQSHFFTLARRLKWFFIVMWLIYAFNTPGEHLRWWPFSIAPTLEGAQAGILQLLRILMMLSALSIILASNSREQLIAGFYFLLTPLRWLGVDTERFAARLWLTMHYVENQPSLIQGPHFVDYVRQALIDTATESDGFSMVKDPPMVIEWEKPQFTICDIFLFGLMLSIGVLLIWI